jgi:TonB family protein|tara:strand:+ start:23682 stop:24899 length:1218 start_codon:yes stop_codon:yes gene_type:complete
MVSFSHLVRALRIPAIAFALTAVSAQAQTPYDEFHPYFEAFVPAVIAHEELPEDAASPTPVATVIGTHGEPIGKRIAANGDPLPHEPKGFEKWAPARSFGDATVGAIWAAPAASFHFAIDTTQIELPKPRFSIPRIEAEKFLLISRALVKKFVRIEIEIAPSGKITRIEADNKTITRLAKELFEENKPKKGHHFEPARTLSDGEPYRIRGEMRWDLSTRPKGGIIWKTDTLAWDDLKGPKEEIPVYVKADGLGGVRGAWLANNAFQNHRALHKVLLTALSLPMSGTEPGDVERWSLRVSPILNTVRLFRRQKIDHRAPIMLIAPRPEYPRKLWRRGSEGYVYVRFLIGPEGETKAIEIIESSKTAFEDAALDALKLWEFEPALFNGRKITSEVIMTLPFRVPPRR